LLSDVVKGFQVKFKQWNKGIHFFCGVNKLSRLHATWNNFQKVVKTLSQVFLNLSMENALIVEKIAGKKKQQLDMVTKTWHTLQDSTIAWQGLDRS